ncbi:MAG: TIGR01459 family HAD-type hydrolase [Proteobacteria bacterium]|nr:TIGR01459 family HAD-type hydrolase [Pseudomonadota bacterium]
MAIPVLPGLAPLAERYEAFVLDLWGVVHDGTTPYPGAIDCLRRLRARGRAVAFLSNAPRRSAVVAAAMAAMGIPAELYSAILTSGEAVHEELARRRDPWFAALGRRCFHLGSERDASVTEGLALDFVAAPEEAEFVLNTGPAGFDETVGDYRPILARAAARRLPMVCANPDYEVIRQGRRAICAGMLARVYEEMGGSVAYRGKPYPEVFRRALEMLGLSDSRRALVVGDSLRTDIAGARRAGLAAAFITGGIHAAELGLKEGDPPDPAAVAALCARTGEFPVAALGALSW